MKYHTIMVTLRYLWEEPGSTGDDASATFLFFIVDPRE